MATDTSYAKSDEFVACVQHSLSQLGFDPGPVDGLLGSATRGALSEYQSSFLGEGNHAALSVDTALSECINLSVNGVTAHRIAVDNGIELEGFLHRPLGNGRAFPAAIILHGWGGSAREVNYTARLFTASGIAALTISLRGWGQSDGVDDCGLEQSDDIVAVLDWLAEHPEIDANRIGMLGYSQGGQVALLSAAKSERPRYVVSFFPPIELESWAAQTTNSGIPEYVRSVCSPEITARSPIGVASSISAPVLLVHGTKDSRVPVTQSLQMAEALKATNGSVEMKLVPGQPHLFSKDAWEDIFPDVLEFAREKSITIQNGVGDTDANTSYHLVQKIDTLLDIPALSISTDEESSISLISPSCSSCFSHFFDVLRNPASTKAENEHILLFFAQNDADLEIVSNLMCDRSKTASITVEYFSRASLRSHFIGHSSETDFASGLLHLSAEIAGEHGVTHERLSRCVSNTELAERLVAASSLVSRGFKVREGDPIGRERSSLSVAMPWLRGGAGVGPNNTQSLMAQLTAIRSRLLEMQAAVQRISVQQQHIVETTTNSDSARVRPPQSNSSLPIRVSQEEPTSSLSEVRRQLANEILSDYQHNLGAIRNIATHADYAMLAWLAYDSSAQEGASLPRGWRQLRRWDEDFVGFGDLGAKLFVGPNGEHVLSFRGTDQWQDWITDNLSSVAQFPTPMLERVRELAYLVSNQYDDVTFVGHSLGGRLANIAHSATGRDAVVFDAAFRSVSDLTVGALFGERGGEVLSFSSPGDPLSSLTPFDDQLVMNYPEFTERGVIGQIAIGEFDDRALFDHNPGTLALAMRDVKTRLEWIEQVVGE